MDAFNKFISNPAVCKVLANNESLIASNTDILPIINKALDSVITKDFKKSESLAYIATYTSQKAYNRLGNNVDKLPALVETSNTPADRVSMTEVLTNMLMDYNTDISTQLPKILTKLVGVACRLASKDDAESSQYGLDILKILAQSKARSIMVPYTKQVRNTCITILSNHIINDDNTHMKLLAEVFALYTSMETSENWLNIWNQVVQDSITLLATIGISMNKTIPGMKKTTKNKPNSTANTNGTSSNNTKEFLLLNDDECNLVKLKGVNKVIRVQQLYHGFCSILSQLLLYGCSTGFVALNFTEFLPNLQLLLSYSAEVAVKDPVSYIEGDYGVSPMDISLALSLLKIDILHVVITVLSIDHPALVRIGTGLMRPVAALMTRTEGKTVQKLNLILLQCITTAARCLPSVVANSINSTPLCLLEQLSKEMHILTTNQGLLSQSYSTSTAANSTTTATTTVNKDGNLSFSTGVNSVIPVNFTGQVITNSSGNINEIGTIEASHTRYERLTVLFTTAESVLLYCGSLLSASIREQFTSIVNQGLTCMNLGLLSVQYIDRHLHRSNCALLRQDPIVQCLLLQLSLVEVFCTPQLSQQIQQYSRNLSLLKHIAELCMRNSITSIVAARILLQYSTLYHPVTVALPGVPASDTARGYILNTTTASADQYNTVVPLSTTATTTSLHPTEISTTQVTTSMHDQMIPPTLAINNNDNKRQNHASDEKTQNKRMKMTDNNQIKHENETVLSSQPPSIQQNMTTITTHSNIASTKAMNDLEEEDMSLPDLDIDAEPDSD